MYDYNRIGTDQLKQLLATKAKRYNRLKAHISLPRVVKEDELLVEQMTLIRAVIFAREATLKLWED